MKRIITVILAILLLGSAALAEVWPVGCYGDEERLPCMLLIRDDGTPLTPLDTYDSIYCITPDGTPEAERRYSVTPCQEGVIREGVLMENGYPEYNRVALMDGAGKLLTGYDYTYLTWVGPNAIVFTREDERAGVMDADGRVLFEGDYLEVAPDGQGGYLAVEDVPERVVDDQNEEDEVYALVHIDADGARRPMNLRLPAYGLGQYVEGLCPINFVWELGGGGLYLNAEGEPAFRRTFDQVEKFHGGIAEVSVNERWGVIDTQGRYILPPIYEKLSFDGKYCVAVKGNVATVMDTASRETVFKKTFEDCETMSVDVFGSNLVRVSSEEMTRIYDIGGELLYTEDEEKGVYLYFESCSGKITRMVEEWGNWPDETEQLVDLEGNPLGPEYQSLMGRIWQDGHARYITETYRLGEGSDGEAYYLWNTSRYGVCDENGETLLPPVYQNLEVLSMERCWVQRDNLIGLVDMQGKWYYTLDAYSYLMD